jgi:hypothetical protein
MVPMPTQRGSPSIQSLKAEVKRHEALERKLYDALISTNIRKNIKSADIYEELWNYAEEQSGFIPEEEGFFDDY